MKAERLLYCALIGYIYYEAPEEEQNFSTLLEFINASEAREDDEEFKNAVDELFEELEKEKPEHFAVRQYKKYKLAAGKTAKSILISCGARLAPFDIAELRELTSYDEMELDMLGDQRTAMFVIISDTDDTFNFVVAIVADIQEVRRIQSNVRVCDVLRRQPYFVMDDVAGRISAYLTQAAVNVDAGSNERRAALAPLC